MRKLISLFLFLFLILSGLNLFLIFNVKALDTTTNFTTGTLGASYFQDSYINITRSSGGSVITTVDYHSSPKSYGGAIAQWVQSFLTVDTTSLFLTSYGMWWKPGSGVDTYDLKFYNSSDVMLHFTFSSTSLTFYPYGGGTTVINFATMGIVWKQFGFEILTEDNIRFWVDNPINGTSAQGAPVYGAFGIKRLDRCDFICGGSPMYEDDVNLTFSANYGNASTYGDVSSYLKLSTGYEGHLANSLLDEYRTFVAGFQIDSGYLGSTYIQNQINSEMDIIVKAIDLHIGVDQYTVAHNLSDYQMYINGVSLGSPTYFVPSTYGYKLRWIYFSNTIEDEKPLIEFSCNKFVTYDNINWYWWSVYTDDTLPYGYYQFKHHVINELFSIGVYPSVQWYPDVFLGFGTQYRVETHNNGLAMDMYYVLATPPSIYPYAAIYTDKTNYQTYENVQITGNINDSSSQYYIKIYNSTGQCNIWGYLGNGKLVTPSQNGEFIASFVPFNSDAYIVCLQKNFENMSKAFFNVTNRTDMNFVVYTNPNPSDIGQIINGYYIYSSTYPGAIIVSNYPTFSNNYLGIIINGFTTGNGQFTYPGLNSPGILYFYVCENLGNGSFNSRFSYPHYVGTTSGSGQLYIQSDLLNLEMIDNIIQATQHIWGHISNPSIPTAIRDNAGHLTFITGISDFSLDFIYYDTGSIQLELVSNYYQSQQTILDTKNFIINDYVPITPEQQQHQIYNILIGLAITVLIMLIPIVFSIYGANISMPIYLLFLFIGCVICSIIGLFPYFIPASIIVCEILGIIVLKFWR